MQSDIAELKQLLATVLQTNADLVERIAAAPVPVDSDDVSSIRAKASILSTIRFVQLLISLVPSQPPGTYLCNMC